MIFLVPKMTQMILKWIRIFQTDHKGNTITRSPLSFLGPKSNDKKVKREIRKKDNGKHRGDGREVVERGGRILKINIY